MYNLIYRKCLYTDKYHSFITVPVIVFILCYINSFSSLNKLADLVRMYHTPIPCGFHSQAMQYDMDLECLVEAYPPPSITWLKDGIVLNNNQHHRLAQKRASVLIHTFYLGTYLPRYLFSKESNLLHLHVCNNNASCLELLTTHFLHFFHISCLNTDKTQLGMNSFYMYLGE